MRSRIAVTRHAPIHEQGFVLISEGHLVHPPVAGDAADSLVNVNVVIEIDELRQIVDALPGDRFAAAKTGADRLQHGAAEPDLLMAVAPDLGMAVHARLGRRDAGEGRILDRGMTVAAIDAELADMVLVAERDGLDPRQFGLAYVGRPADDIEEPAAQRPQHKESREARFRDRIETAVKNLRHNASSAAKQFRRFLPRKPGLF